MPAHAASPAAKTELYLHLTSDRPPRPRQRRRQRRSAGPGSGPWRSSGPPRSPGSRTGPAGAGSPSNPSSTWAAPTPSTHTTHPPGCGNSSSSATGTACSPGAPGMPEPATSITPLLTRRTVRRARLGPKISRPSADGTTARKPSDDGATTAPPPATTTDRTPRPDTGPHGPGSPAAADVLGRTAPRQAAPPTPAARRRRALPAEHDHASRRTASNQATSRARCTNPPRARCTAEISTSLAPTTRGTGWPSQSCRRTAEGRDLRLCWTAPGRASL